MGVNKDCILMELTNDPALQNGNINLQMTKFESKQPDRQHVYSYLIAKCCLEVNLNVFSTKQTTTYISNSIKKETNERTNKFSESEGL